MNSLPQLLDTLAKHPGMFVHPVTFPTVQGYLQGLADGLRLAGVGWSSEEYYAAADARGYDPRSSIGILRDFTRKGLSDEEMVRELIAVEAAAYRLALARTDKPAEPAAAPDRRGE